MPAFTSLFKDAATTGKISPVATLNALCSISPSAQKFANNTINTVQRGGNISDVVQSALNHGDIEMFGQTINTKEIPKMLKESGGNGILNVLGNLTKQSPEDIINFGNEASNVNNWQDIITQ